MSGHTVRRRGDYILWTVDEGCLKKRDAGEGESRMIARLEGELGLEYMRNEEVAWIRRGRINNRVWRRFVEKEAEGRRKSE